MRDRANNLWPFTARTAILAVPFILLAAFVALSLARSALGWPSPANERVVLIGILVLSLLPLLLIFMDALFQRGAVIEFKGLKLNLAQVAPATPSVAPVPANIGVRAKPVNDSSSAEILASLETAVNNEVVTVDLEDGQAWWETRLLVLLAGAARLDRPRAVVFLGTLAGRNQQFLGWAYSQDLFHRLLHSDQQYLLTYYTTKSAANQWALVAPNVTPPNPPLTGLANQYSWMMARSGSVNEFAEEQLFASELGTKIEQPPPQQPRAISAVRLQDLFGAFLHTGNIDQQASSEDQLRQFATGDAEYIGVTRAGQYLQLVRRVAVLTAMVARSSST